MTKPLGFAVHKMAQTRKSQNLRSIGGNCID
jgi:hypothetical protein